MSKAGAHWKRPATHVYDYNYNIGEHYYKPQLSYADKRFNLRDRAGSPPKAKTFAERFAEDPVWGVYGLPSMRTSVGGSTFGPRRASLGGEDFSFPSRRAPNDEDFGLSRRPGNDEDIFRRKPPNEDDFFRRRRAPLDDDEPRNEEFRRPRFNFGDQLLDAAGARSGRQVSPSPVRGGGAARSAGILDSDPFEDEFFRKPRRTAPKATDFDEPVRSRNVKTLAASDDLDDDYSHDAESVLGRIRSKLRARKEKQGGLSALEDNDDFGQSRFDQLRSKAKARVTNFEDDFAGISLEPKAREQISRINNLSSKYMDDDDSPGVTGSKSILVKRRTVRSTFDD